MSNAFFKKGLHFECQGSGKCCMSRGEYGFVYLTKLDLRRMAKHFDMTITDFKKEYCAVTGGVLHLVQPENMINCRFLTDKRCDIYEARPVQCRTWPFWPENMNAKAWKRDVVGFCPGAQIKKKSALKPAEIIKKQVDEQQEAEEELFGI